MMRLLVIFLLLIMPCSTILLAECKTRMIKDALGHSVIIPVNVMRVATGGALNQIVLMLGGADKIVATSDAIRKNPFFVKIYPGIVNVAAPFGNGNQTVNIESLLASKPEVVFGKRDQYLSTDLPVIEIDLTNSDGIKHTVEIVGHTLGQAAEVKADLFVRYYDSIVTRVKKRAETIPSEKRVRVFTAGGKDGFSTDGKNTIADCWITYAGGLNVGALAGYDGLGKSINIELLYKYDPQVVFTSAALKTSILSDPRWSKITAVRNGRVYVSPKGVYLWSVRSGEGALQYLYVAKMMYPDVYKDINLQQETRKFYKTFYGYLLSDEELAAIFNPDN